MWVVIVEEEGAIWGWGEFRASYCNQWGLCCIYARATQSSQITLRGLVEFIKSF